MAVAQPVTTAVLEYLSDSGACFVQEVLRSRRLRPHASQVEEALAELECNGRVLVRPHSAGDPHLEGTDLRIVALVQTREGTDGLSEAVSAIDKTWDGWLAEFLANHRCT